MNSNQISDEQFNFDIKRSIILAEYIRCWGMPETRKLMHESKKTGDSLSYKKMLVELYVFPGEDMDQVTRVATIGLSSCKSLNDKICHNELLMVLPFDVADDNWESVSGYIVEISNYIVNTLGRNIKTEDLMEESDSAPAGWPKALLFDDPRGEPMT